MFRLRAMVRQVRFGIAVAALIVAGTAVYVQRFGALYGAWGWPELVLGGLILAASGLAGIEAAFRAPNPYARTYVLYDLSDVSPNRDLDSGGSGWMIQALPSVLTAVVLIGYFLIV